MLPESARIRTSNVEMRAKLLNSINNRIGGFFGSIFESILMTTKKPQLWLQSRLRTEIEKSEFLYFSAKYAVYAPGICSHTDVKCRNESKNA